MIEKELLLIDIQRQMHESEDPNVKTALATIISEIISGTYNVRIW
jgi:hypothetical protein